MSDRNISFIADDKIYATINAYDNDRLLSFMHYLRHNFTNWQDFMCVDWNRARQIPLSDLYPILIEKGLITDD